MATPDAFDFWYAVNHTEIILMPSGHLETFGSTILHYHVLSELMDCVGKVRIREGRLLAMKPEIITPAAYSQILLEGFGEQASRYIQWIREHETDLRILQYGYRLRRESFSEHILSDKMETVVERVRNTVREKGDLYSAVVVGVDEPWDVCLIKLFRELIARSAPRHVAEMAQRRLFDDDAGVPRGVREDIESAFSAAARHPSLIPALGKKLQRLQLFEEYQDRFFSLLKSRTA